jgi:hypothetical protein
VRGFTAMRAVLLLPGLLMIVVLADNSARASSTVSFTIEDALARGEVAEDTSVSINSQPVAHFHLDLDHPGGLVRVTVPEAARYEYTLCGVATTRTAGQDAVQHRVNDSGTIASADGRYFSAYTDQYTSYFLRDVTPDEPPTDITIHEGPRCVGPIAGRLHEEKGRG